MKKEVKKPELKQIPSYYVYDEIHNYIKKKYNIITVLEWDKYDLLDYIYDNTVTGVSVGDSDLVTANIKSGIDNKKTPTHIVEILKILVKDFDVEDTMTFLM